MLKKLKKNIEFWHFQRTFGRRFHFYTTNTKKDLDDIFKIRYQVYCLERDYLDKENYPDQREQDIYDQHAIHFILRDQDNNIAASVRLILFSELGFPIEKHFKLDVEIPNNEKKKLAEISRLVVAKKYRKKYLMLALIKGLFTVVKQHGISLVYSVLDDNLSPVLLNFGLPFKKIGSPTLYQGITAPYIIEVSEMEEKLKEINPRLHNYLTSGSVDFDYNKQSFTIH